MEYKNSLDKNIKNVLVCGVAISGISAARMLLKLGLNVTLQDLKTAETLGLIVDELANEGFNLYLGKNPEEEIILKQDLVVLSPVIPLDLPFIAICTNNNIPVIGEIELGYLCGKGTNIAITGTNGKTTTTTLVGEIIQKYSENTNVIGNIGVPFCDKALETTDDSINVFELSSYQLETVNTYKAHICGILNITPDHLMRHKTMENYVKAKENIFKNQNKDDFTVLNYDDNYCKEMAKNTNGNIIYISLKEPVNGVYLDGKNIIVNMLGVKCEFFNIDDLIIFGAHNVQNVLMAIGICICAKVPFTAIKDGLRQFKGVEHRNEYVTTINEVEFYNDSKATNPEAAIPALISIDKPIILIAGGSYKNVDYSPLVAMFSEKVKYLITIGEVADEINEVCKTFNYDKFEKVNTLKDAISLAYGKAEKGDCVLLSPACASFDMFSSYEQRGKMFKQFVYELGEGVAIG